MLWLFWWLCSQVCATQGPAGYIAVTLPEDSRPTSSTEHCSLQHAVFFETAFFPTIPPAEGPKFGPWSL